MRAARRALSARRPQAWRERLRSGGGRGALADRSAKIKAVDTTGAGDAFVAAFLAARLQGAEIETALERAVTAGAEAATRVGGGPGGRPCALSP